jgi:excisionase family DNA binding protein
MNPIERVLEKLPDAKRSGAGWVALCPAHQDRTPSLSISEGDDGRALIHCHAGCATSKVASALGLPMSDLMPPRNRAFDNTRPHKTQRTASGASADAAAEDHAPECGLSVRDKRTFETSNEAVEYMEDRLSQVFSRGGRLVTSDTITPSPPPLLLYMPETATRLRLGERTVWRLAKCNALPSVMIGRSRRFSPIELDAWISLGAPIEPGSADLVRASLRKGGR